MILVEEVLSPVLDAGLYVVTRPPGAQEVTGRGEGGQTGASPGQSHLTTEHRAETEETEI